MLVLVFVAVVFAIIYEDNKILLIMSPNHDH
jgi:hypothetical protein